MEESAEGRRDTNVFVGVDTHSDAHVAVALDAAGRRLGVLAVPNCEAGYAQLLAWVLGFGDPVAAGVEGTVRKVNCVLLATCITSSTKVSADNSRPVEVSCENFALSLRFKHESFAMGFVSLAKLPLSLSS